MLKEILFTHDDMDGAGCRIVFELSQLGRKKGVVYDVMNCSNGNIDCKTMERIDKDDISPEETIIFFADIVPSEEVLRELLTSGFDVKIFDHHKSNLWALDLCPVWDIRVHNLTGELVSGTSILYQHLVKEMMVGADSRYKMFMAGNVELLANLVDAIRQYDTWEWKARNNYEPKNLQSLFFLLGMEGFTSRFLKRLMNPLSGSNLLLDSDMEFLRAKEDSAKLYISNFTPDDVIDISIANHKAALIIGSRPVSVSELGSAFLNKYSEYDIFVQYILSGEGAFYSFRSTDGRADVSHIAVALGGGGHAAAAGAKMGEEGFKSIVSSVIKELTELVE